MQAILGFLGHSGPFWAILGHSGPFWAILGHSGPLWAILGRFGPFRSFSVLPGPFWANPGRFGPFRSFSVLPGPFWPFWVISVFFVILGVFGSFWSFCDFCKNLLTILGKIGQIRLWLLAAAACCLLAVRSTPKNRFSPGPAKRRRVGRKLWALPRGCYGRPCRCTASEVLAKVVFTIFWGLGWSVLSETIEIEL